MYSMYNINKQLHGRTRYSMNFPSNTRVLQKKQSIVVVVVVDVNVVVQLCASRTAYLTVTASHAGRIQYERYVEHFTFKQ